MKLFDRKFGNAFLDSVPLDPGVYRYLDASGEILYVGKAIRLRRRLQQYRNATRLKRHRKMREILRAAASLEFETCVDHRTACLLELKQIQEWRPRFNVASAYSFLYPFVGVRQGEGGRLELFLTSDIGRLQDQSEVSWHGAFRSRYWARQLFEGLDELLGYVAHRVSSAKRVVPRTRGVWVLEFRAVPRAVGRELEGFLSGRPENTFLAELSLLLLENAGARIRRSEIQELLRNQERFWKNECARLHRARLAVGCSEYPVAQHRRDEIFLVERLGCAPGLGR